MIFASGLAMAESEVPQANKSCLTCHAKDISTKHDGEKVSLKVTQSELSESVHKSLTCNSCHTKISGYPHEDKVYGTKLAARVSESCQMCHADVSKNYKDSMHWKLTKGGAKDISCSECHDSHNIQKPEYTKHEEVELCADCHDGEILETYEESYHGKAVSLGSEKAASCIDCHGAHNALGPENENSPVSEENTPKTCAKCHDKPRENFTKGAEHAVMAPGEEGAPMYWTLKFFTWLTILTIVFLVLHIIVELIGKFRKTD